MKAMPNPFSALVKQERKRTGMTQEQLALTAGVGLRFVRDLEQGKSTLRLDKVDQVLWLFGYRTGPIRMEKPDA
jgi:y4mF family transcriptional regulator